MPEIPYALLKCLSCESCLKIFYWFLEMCLFHEIKLTSYVSVSKAVVPWPLLFCKTKVMLSYSKDIEQGSNWKFWVFNWLKFFPFFTEPQISLYCSQNLALNPVLSHFNAVYIVIESLSSILILPCSRSQTGGLFPAGCLDNFCVCIIQDFCTSPVSFCFIQSSQWYFMES